MCHIVQQIILQYTVINYGRERLWLREVDAIFWELACRRKDCIYIYETFGIKGKILSPLMKTKAFETKNHNHNINMEYIELYFCICRDLLHSNLPLNFQNTSLLFSDIFTASGYYWLS